MLFRVEVFARPNCHDARCSALRADIAALGINPPDQIEVRDVYFLDGDLSVEDVRLIGARLLCDPIVQDFAVGDYSHSEHGVTVEVLLKPGVTDAVAEELLRAAAELGVRGLRHAATGARYILYGSADEATARYIARRLLANEVIQMFAVNRALSPRWQVDAHTKPHVNIIALRDADDEALIAISSARRLALNLHEMRAIRDYFTRINREPTDAEIETLAQTWSEHCVHKTFKAPIEITAADPAHPLHGRTVEGLLKSFIKRATDTIAAPWVKSAFVDNAGVIAFDDEFDIAFKVETHNHPSAIEPFGGANTGVGGVIRDVIAVSARPLANTDVLCFGPQEATFDVLPEGVLHPRRIRAGVVAGIEDYGNKMGIPTVSGAIVYDEGYIANPLVFCGCVGLAPVDAHPRQPQVGDRIIVLGGRTGRDGLRGATFSSSAITAETSNVAGASVQIGNPIVEKNVMEVVMAARDARLYHAITDCGAGGLSSAIGEMGAALGVRVHLERVSLKYPGLEPWEIWLSEAQERMVLAVPTVHVELLRRICARFGCEMSDVGEFTGDQMLRVFYGDQRVCELEMSFLHGGLPMQRRRAVIATGATRHDAARAELPSPAVILRRMLAHPNVASKEDVIRRYDHEVQGGTVVKPLVGVRADSPSDAAVIKPQGTRGVRGIALGCGINPFIGRRNPYAMAVSVVDEAIRNVVCVGADPTRIALLDNFCWGDVHDPVVLGELVEACRGCHDAAIHYRAPFVSGKDSLNNTYRDATGCQVSVPGTVLISALGIVEDIQRCVTMDAKAAGDFIYLLGETKEELGGSLLEQCFKLPEGKLEPPALPTQAPAIYAALHRAIQLGLVRAAHDPSEGGVGVALAEMAQAGGLGIRITLPLPEDTWSQVVWLFSESNGRVLVEVSPKDAAQFEALFQGLPCARVGEVEQHPGLRWGEVEMRVG